MTCSADNKAETDESRAGNHDETERVEPQSTGSDDFNHYGTTMYPVIWLIALSVVI